MKLFISSWLMRVALGITFGLSTLSLSGADGRDFAGFYEATDVVDNGDETVTLTFTADVFNYSDSDVAAAVVVLADSLFFDEYASAPDIWLADREKVRIQGSVTVPLREYEQWQQGASPFLFIEYSDSSGNTLRRSIELIQMPFGEE